MLHIIIATHGPLANALLTSARMIFGKLENTSTVCLDEEGGIEQFKQDFQQVVEQCSEQVDGVLVLCDLQGGTPYNVACYHAFTAVSTKPIAVVSGVNLPLLLMSNELITLNDPHAAAQQLISEAIHSIVHAQPVVTELIEDDF